jgi:hypothetical protein
MEFWYRYTSWPRRDPALRPGERPNWLRTLRGERLQPRRTEVPRACSTKPVIVAYQGAR